MNEIVYEHLWLRMARTKTDCNLKKLGKRFQVVFSRLRNIDIYYMTSSVSGQDETNPVLWLATRAVKLEQSWPPGIARCVPASEKTVQFRRRYYKKLCRLKLELWNHFPKQNKYFLSVSIERESDNKEIGLEANENKLNSASFVNFICHNNQL